MRARSSIMIFGSKDLENDRNKTLSKVLKFLGVREFRLAGGKCIGET